MAHYAVRQGRVPGIYGSWAEAEAQVKGYAHAEHKKFRDKEEAERWLGVKRVPESPAEESEAPPRKKVRVDTTTVVYCDGSCLGNGTPEAKAGIGVWFGHANERNLGEALPATTYGTHTNQKAELWAAIRALQQLKPDEPVRLYTDSQYTIKSAQEWRRRWKAKQWRVKLDNLVLLRLLSDTIDARQATTEWVHVRGHTGIEGNEAADALARQSVQ